jgi:hypothetical protein
MPDIATVLKRLLLGRLSWSLPLRKDADGRTLTNAETYLAVQVSELQKRCGSRVMGCYYVRRPELELEQKNTDEYGRKISQMVVYADRSYWVERAISIIKNKNEAGDYAPKLRLPWRQPSLVEWSVDHFTCIEMEEQETISGRRYHHYKHPEGEPDDALHAFIYALIAEEVGRLP